MVFELLKGAMAVQYANPQDLFADRTLPLGLTGVSFEKYNNFITGIRVSDNMSRSVYVPLAEPIDQAMYSKVREVVGEQVKMMQKLQQNENMVMEKSGSIRRGKATTLDAYGRGKAKFVDAGTGEEVVESRKDRQEQVELGKFGGEAAAAFMDVMYNPEGEKAERKDSYKETLLPKPKKIEIVRKNSPKSEGSDVEDMPKDESALGKYSLSFGKLPLYAEA